MTDNIWRLIARFIAARPALVAWLVRVAHRTSYLHIDGSDGTRYMSRWWLIKERRWLPFAVRIHHIVRPDLDRALHDHPFAFRTLLLQGFYVEQSLDGTRRLLGPGDTYRSAAERFHRIDWVDARTGVYTLFILGRRTNAWGFLLDGCKVPWRKYLARPTSPYRDGYPKEP